MRIFLPLFLLSGFALGGLLLLQRRYRRRLDDPEALLAHLSAHHGALVSLVPFPVRLATALSAVLACVALGGLLFAEDESGLVNERPMTDSTFAPPQQLGGGLTSAASLHLMIEKLRPLHRPLGPVAPGEWLDLHHETGQSFAQYLNSMPTVPTAARRVIYIQPIGPFSAKQGELLRLTAGFMARYFCLPVKVNEPLPLSAIPPAAQRDNPFFGMHQILTRYVLEGVLKPRLPDDAFAYLGLTATDLWPGGDWNFVFGEASLDERVGVYSIYRNGNLEGSAAGWRQALLRTLKIAVHETGHMLSIRHCTHYACNMNGSNSLAETDRQPLALCPECLAKLVWATRCDAVARYRSLRAFCAQHGLVAEAAIYEKLQAALSTGRAVSQNSERTQQNH